MKLHWIIYLSWRVFVFSWTEMLAPKTTCCYSCTVHAINLFVRHWKKNNHNSSWRYTRRFEVQSTLIFEYFFSIVCWCRNYIWNGKSHTFWANVMYTQFKNFTFINMALWVLLHQCFVPCKRWNIVAWNLHLDDDGNCRWLLVSLQ